MIYDQKPYIYNPDKFHGHQKKKIFWPFHQCTPYSYLNSDAVEGLANQIADDVLTN